MKLEHDQWKRPIVYFARWQNSIGASSFCIFSDLDTAIYFVVTGLGNDVDWRTFPDAHGKYPYEERNGNEPQQLTPVFRVDREVAPAALYPRSGRVLGEVYRTGVASEWIVGNGIACASERWMKDAIKRSVVRLTGGGDKLQGTVDKSGLI